MELTNLIWHLGAALAALWAALAYRRLNAQYIELRHTVLLSVLPAHQAREAVSSSDQALSPAERSMRVRALGWVLLDLKNSLGLEFAIDGRDALMGVQQEQWSQALAGLLSFSAFQQRPKALYPCVDQRGAPLAAEKLTQFLAESKASQKTIRLKWQGEFLSGRGGWQWLEL